jgi:hypothetical protein
MIKRTLEFKHHKISATAVDKKLQVNALDVYTALGIAPPAGTSGDAMFDYKEADRIAADLGTAEAIEFQEWLNQRAENVKFGLE